MPFILVKSQPPPFFFAPPVGKLKIEYSRFGVRSPTKSKVNYCKEVPDIFVDILSEPILRSSNQAIGYFQM